MKYLILILFLFSCNIINKKVSNGDFKTLKLSFSKCVIGLDSYEKLKIDIPRNFIKKRNKNEGMCEYSFKYNDSSIFYISNNVWFGSHYNFENRHNINHLSYNRKSLRDTIEILGIQKNGLYWKEKIMGDVMIGYINVPKSKQKIFDEIYKSIRKE